MGTVKVGPFLLMHKDSCAANLPGNLIWLRNGLLYKKKNSSQGTCNSRKGNIRAYLSLFIYFFPFFQTPFIAH